MSLTPEGWAAVGTAASVVVGAGGAAIVNWMRSAKAESRADHEAATIAWRALFEAAELRARANVTRTDQLSETVSKLNDAVAECQEKHQECEEKHMAVVSRLNDLEGSVRVVEKQVQNGNGH